jgi:hypothetical protein
LAWKDLLSDMGCDLFLFKTSLSRISEEIAAELCRLFFSLLYTSFCAAFYAEFHRRWVREIAVGAFHGFPKTVERGRLVESLMSAETQQDGMSDDCLCPLINLFHSNEQRNLCQSVSFVIQHACQL